MSTPAAGRRCGVLFHPTSLPHTPCCGSLGQEAHRWLALLAAEGVGVWQVLPLAPSDGTGSPYNSPSSFALNPWLLDAESLLSEAFISPEQAAELPVGSHDRLDLDAAPRRAAALGAALCQAWPEQDESRQRAFRLWSRRQRHWLDDHCRFMVLRRLHGGRPWWEWPGPMARRHGRALRFLARLHGDALLEEALLQWHLHRQWQALQHRARQHGIALVGDLPFYVAHDSADVWSHRPLFSLAFDGSLQEQSGVPPDYFSATGQLWGTPVYRWWGHRLTGFRWWLRRLEHQLDLFDELRIDHFRALEAFWSVPGGAATAEGGRWCPSPGWALLRALRRRRRSLPLIAEDLGVITPEVERLRDHFGLPGMKILQFAFDGNPDNPYLPANIHGSNWVVYTGTHDNATSRGWWESLDGEARWRLQQAVGAAVTAPGWQLLELALASPAGLALVPLQDLLELGDGARFNTPGTASGNWCWRLQQPIASLAGPLRGFGEMARRYGR
ncbi:MAG: 4-alpha-glucanotransferase [Prochlorococcaceae cyanobacterium]